MNNTTKQFEKDQMKPESKPEKLAKIMYEGIVRYRKSEKVSNSREKQRFRA